MDQIRANTPAPIKANLMTEQLSVQMSWGNGGCTRAGSPGDQQSRELGPWAARRSRAMLRANAWGHDELRFTYRSFPVEMSFLTVFSKYSVMVLSIMFSYHDAETVRIANDGSFIVNTSCTGLLSWKATAKYRPNKTVESVKISKIIHRSDVEVTFELYFTVISDVYRFYILSKCSQVSGFVNCSNF